MGKTELLTLLLCDLLFLDNVMCPFIATTVCNFTPFSKRKWPIFLYNTRVAAELLAGHWNTERGFEFILSITSHPNHPPQML